MRLELCELTEKALSKWLQTLDSRNSFFRIYRGKTREKTKRETAPRTRAEKISNVTHDRIFIFDSVKMSVTGWGHLPFTKL